MTKQINKTKSTTFWQKHSKTIIDWIVFAIGVITCCFTRFTFNMWFCALIFPPCFIFFERRQKAYIGLPAIFAGSMLACGISAWKLVIAEGAGLQIALDFVLALLIVIPFILDKLVYVKFFSKRPLVLSFLFPLTWVIIDIILGLTPVGNIPSIAYSLCQLIQVVSVISFLGMNFVTFIIMYLATAIAQFAIDWKANIKAIIVASSLSLFSLSYSGIYYTIPNDTSTNIKVMTGYSTNDGDGYERTKLDIYDNIKWLAADVHKAVTANAEMLVYPEESFWLYESEVDNFKQIMTQLAVNNNLYIISGVEVHKGEKIDTGKKNCAWIISPNGECIEYVKRHMVPVDETGYDIGDGNAKFIDIPNKGRIGIVICMDLEFPTYLTQIGRMGCDTLIAPSWDWDTMHSIHSMSTAYRAVENGVNFLRCTEAGTTLACDYKGNVIAQYYTAEKDPIKTTHNNHVFNLPMKGRRTAYSYLGLATNYMYPVALASLIIVFAVKDYAFKKKDNKKK